MGREFEKQKVLIQDKQVGSVRAEPRPQPKGCFLTSRGHLCFCAALEFVTRYDARVLRLTGV